MRLPVASACVHCASRRPPLRGAPNGKCIFTSFFFLLYHLSTFSSATFRATTAIPTSWRRLASDLHLREDRDLWHLTKVSRFSFLAVTRKLDGDGESDEGSRFGSGRGATGEA